MTLIILQWGPQAAIFDFTMNQKFDVAIMIFIMLNMVTMCAEYDNQPDEYTEVCCTKNCYAVFYSSNIDCFRLSTMFMHVKNRLLTTSAKIVR